MKLIDIIFETVDFFHEFQDTNPCEFSDSLPSNRGKLYKLITDYTITRLDLNFRRENGLETETNFRNAFFKKIPEEFVIINKKIFLNAIKLENEIEIFLTSSKSTLLFLPKK